MKTNEFKSWFQGFIMAMNGVTPTPEQWAKIVDKILELDDSVDEIRMPPPLTPLQQYQTPSTTVLPDTTVLPRTTTVITCDDTDIGC